MTDLVTRAMAHPGVWGSLYLNASGPDEARQIIKALGGLWEKESVSGTYWLQRKEGDFTIHVFIPSMCEKVQVGEEIIPAQPATKAQVVPKYEYRCKDLHEAIGG